MSTTNVWKIMWNEIKNDKLALIGLIFFIVVVATVYIWYPFIDQTAANRVDILNRHVPWGDSDFILGTDSSGRDMLSQLIMSARNSFSIAFLIAGGASIIGIFVGLFSGFYGGHVDNVVMRIIDFVGMIPFMMIIITIVAIIPNYSVATFSLIFIIFSWQGTARIIRAKALQQRELDYVSASKTLGTPNIVIIFREVLPNLVSIITSNFTLVLAATMGIETGLTFLGFGLPHGTPSLGRLVFNARVPYDMQNRVWLWLPAALLIILMMLCINFVGQALNRAADAKKRTH